MTVDVTTSIEINRPVEEVATYSANPDNAPMWYVNIQSMEWKSPRPLSIGSEVAFVANFLGRQLSYTYEIVEYIPNQRLVMRTSQGPFPMETTYTWGATTTGTHMTLRNTGEPAGFSKLFAPLMVRSMRQANRNDLANLKQILESKTSSRTT